ncbi:MAG: response regulator [Bacteroidales bacterium]
MENFLQQEFLKKFFLDKSGSVRLSEFAVQCFDVLGLFVIMVNPNNEIIFLNKRASEVLDIHSIDMVGRDFINALVTEKERKRIRSKLDEFCSNNNNNTLNILYCLNTLNEEERIIDAQNLKLLDDNNCLLGILISGKDITDYKKKQQDLRHDLYLYRAMLNNLPEINVFLFDKEMRFIMAEGVEMKNAGFSTDDFLGKKIVEVSVQKIRKIWTPLFDNALNGVDVESAYKLHNLYYVIRVSPLRESDNEISGGMAVLRNVTGEKMSKKILKRTKDEAVRSEKAKSRFLARVSHEIRTPLNAIMGFTEQLMQTKLSVKQSEYVRIIDESSELLLSLVNDILVLSKIEANQVSLEKTPFRLENTVNYVFKVLAAKAEKKKLAFDYEIDDKLNMVLKGDAFRLQQILMNMLTNAIKFTNKGAVKLGCFIYDETPENVIIKFDVSDTGIGISKKHLKAVFKQYIRSISGTGKKYEGTGLGLAICKNLIELQGGSLSVSSQRNVGTTFSFTIPYAKGKDTEILTYDPNVIDPGKLEDVKILLVDDDSVNLFLGKTILKKFNCSFDVANNGSESIDKLNTGKYDLILLDIHMPDISGIEVAKYLRNDKQDNEIRIIALTAAAFKDDIIKYREAGIDDFLIKPFRESSLYNKICEVLQIGKSTVPESKTEVIIKGEHSPKPYSLLEIKKIADDDEAFIDQTIRIFIENSEEAVRKFKSFLKEKNWEQIGETAHKLLPSYRHLEVNSVISKLTEIKIRTLVNKDYDDVSSLVSETIGEIEKVILNLREEISN